MPKYYCDYCDVFLTHDSPSVRKSHNSGWKHKAAVRTYYSQFEEDITQRLIDAKVKEYEEGRSGAALPFPFQPGFAGVYPPQANSPLYPFPHPGMAGGPTGVLPFPTNAMPNPHLFQQPPLLPLPQQHLQHQPIQNHFQNHFQIQNQLVENGIKKEDKGKELDADGDIGM